MSQEAWIKEFSLDHIGVAVPSLAEGQVFYQALAWEDPFIEEVPTEKVRVAMYELANGARVELLEATCDDSPIARFLIKRGPGIHHICYRVDDIEKVVAGLKAKGVRLINETPRLGAHGARVVFVHPSSAGGVLVELSQPSVDQRGES